MAENSKIEWTDHTFNPWMGCTNVSPGCDNCYAEAWAERFGIVEWGNAPRRRTSTAAWRAPIKWNAGAPAFEAKHGRRQRVFCASLADVFDNQVDPAWRADLFALIRAAPNLDWLLLTKRPQNIAKMLPADLGPGWANVWLGCTAEDQARFDQRWPHLSANSAAVHFISYEPAIGPLRLPAEGSRPDWIICGGESGKNARPMTPNWARDIRNDCERDGVAFFFKQWGSFQSNPLVVEQGMTLSAAKAVGDGNGKGGALLDGRLWREHPIRQQQAREAA